MVRCDRRSLCMEKHSRLGRLNPVVAEEQGAIMHPQTKLLCNGRGCTKLLALPETATWPSLTASVLESTPGTRPTRSSMS